MERLISYVRVIHNGETVTALQVGQQADQAGELIEVTLCNGAVPAQVVTAELVEELDAHPEE
jgi:hypothetical protein